MGNVATTLGRAGVSSFRSQGKAISSEGCRPDFPVSGRIREVPQRLPSLGSLARCLGYWAFFSFLPAGTYGYVGLGSLSDLRLPALESLLGQGVGFTGVGYCC